MEADTSAWDRKRGYWFMVGAVAPRPIAWVTTQNDGIVNAAPFSWYQAVCADPPTIMLSIGRGRTGEKDTLRNIRETQEFVVNATTAAAAQTMVDCSHPYPADTSEVEALGLATEPSVAVAAPRLQDSPIHLECRLERIVPYGTDDNVHLVFGRVVHVHADDAVLDEQGNVQDGAIDWLVRLGGDRYATVQDTYPLKARRPA